MAEMIISENYKSAVELNQKIMITAQAAQQNLYDMCVMLKQMRDEKLYKELGYSNFEDYCENEVGLKRRQSYRYISIVENINKESVPSMAQIGSTKLYLLSTLSEEQQEEIQQTVNLEDTSVRELKAEIAKLKAENGRLETEKTDAFKEVLKAKAEQNHLQDTNKELETKLNVANEQIEELESRPQGDTELQKQIDRLHQDLMKADTRNLIDLQEQSDEYNYKIAEMTAEIERLKSQPVTVADAKETFKVYYNAAINSLNQILDFIGKAGTEDKGFFVDKSNELITVFSNNLQLQM